MGKYLAEFEPTEDERAFGFELDEIP